MPIKRKITRTIGSILGRKIGDVLGQKLKATISFQNADKSDEEESEAEDEPEDEKDVTSEILGDISDGNYNRLRISSLTNLTNDSQNEHQRQILYNYIFLFIVIE